jgi:bifunctional enzyme CysN/CysC
MASNLFLENYKITKDDREKLTGYKAKVIWLTGLSGAGKSSIANALEHSLYLQKYPTYILDGDNIRLGINQDLNFSDKDRHENIRRIAEIAKLFLDASVTTIVAAISPFSEDRNQAKKIIGEANYLEIYVATPLNICEERDHKGLYKKARSGNLSNMTGISSSYEVPISPHLIVDTSTESLSSIVEKILTAL